MKLPTVKSLLTLDLVPHLERTPIALRSKDPLSLGLVIVGPVLTIKPYTSKMQSFYNDAFEKEIDDYLASLDPLDEEAEAKYIAYCEEALDRAMEDAIDDFLFGREIETIIRNEWCDCVTPSDDVAVERSEEKFVEFPF